MSFEEDLYAPQSIVHVVDPNSIQRTQYDFDLFPDNVTEVAEYLCLSSCVSVLDQQFDQPCQYYAETTIVIVDPASKLVIISCKDVPLNEIILDLNSSFKIFLL